MKRKLSFLGICLLLVFCFVGCGKPTSQVAFEDAMKQLKNGINYNGKEFNQSDKAILTLVGKASYTVKNVKEEGDKSEIDVNIKAVNMPAYIGEYMSYMMPLAFSEANDSVINATATKYFEDLTKRQDLSYVEKDLTVKLNKVNNKWEIKNGTEVLSAVLGGMDKAFENSGK